MEKRTFGKTGFQVSVLGFGCAPVAYLKSEADAAAKMVRGLLDRGMNLIDTATSYPGSEEFIGQYLSDRRGDFVLVSKLGNSKPAGVSGESWSEEIVATSVDRALKVMKTDSIDVMLLHTPAIEILQMGDAMAALVKARDAGKIKFIGFSGDNESAVYAAKLPEVAVIEASINIADQKNIDLLLPVARENNIGIIAKRPVANAAWKDISTQPGMYKNYAKEYTQRLQTIGLTPGDVGMSDWSEMALRFTLSFPEVSTAIVGTTNPDNAAKNFDAADRGPLPAEAVKVIREKFHAAAGSGEWKGLT